MIDELRRAIEAAEKQSEEIQLRVAEAIAEAIEEAEWDDLVSTPESQDFLVQLAEQARQETAAGKTRDLDELLEE
jgi:hypothetical protein